MRHDFKPQSLGCESFVQATLRYCCCCCCCCYCCCCCGCFVQTAKNILVEKTTLQRKHSIVFNKYCRRTIWPWSSWGSCWSFWFATLPGTCCPSSRWSASGRRSHAHKSENHSGRFGRSSPTTLGKIYNCDECSNFKQENESLGSKGSVLPFWDFSVFSLSLLLPLCGKHQ